MKTKKSKSLMARDQWNYLSVYSKKAHKTKSPSSLLVNNETIETYHKCGSILPQLAKTFKKVDIPPTKRHFSNYLKDPNQGSFFTEPTNRAEEVKDMTLIWIGS